MLTYIGNFKNNFKVNKLMSDEDLKLFYDSLIKKDFINFNMSKVGQGFYPKEIRDTLLKNIVEKYPLNSKICILNDLSLHLYNNMIDLGYKNISLIFGGFKKEGNKISHIENDNSISIIKSLINSNFKEFKNNSTTAILSVKEFLNMNNNININDKFDLVIANPPYEIGNAIITETMKHCEEAVVLMPLSRYKKDGLYKKIKNIDIIPMGTAGFEDADTTPHICGLKSSYNNNFSYEEIQLYSYDQKWIKYYRENLKREASWVRTSYPKTEDIYKMNREKCTFMLTIRTGVDGVHKTKNCTDYKWNLENTFTLGQRGSSRSDKSIPMYTDGVYMGEFATFKTIKERENIIAFWYSSKIMSSIVQGLNKQTFPNVDLFLPKVDWTKPWTDEEILKDYGYTDEEIKEILK